MENDHDYTDEAILTATCCSIGDGCGCEHAGFPADVQPVRFRISSGFTCSVK
jgi:hypothetical protein